MLKVSKAQRAPGRGAAGLLDSRLDSSGASDSRLQASRALGSTFQGFRFPGSGALAVRLHASDSGFWAAGLQAPDSGFRASGTALGRDLGVLGLVPSLL